ncbi:MAG: FxsA family protein [SAR86 cluster bacterium]|jgi:UPF0716 protein FxsA|nr:FxsA family protein [SAR86 cluster bacterium]
MKFLLPIFIILPIIEMYFLIQVGSFIGAISTISLVILTAIIGLMVIKAQGFQALMKAKVKVRNGEMPTEEISTGFFLIISGLFLLTPGFFTDSIGFLFLVPQVRLVIRNLMMFFLPNLFVNPISSKKNPTSIDDDWIEGEFKKED